MVQEILLSCINLDKQARSGRPKTMDSETEPIEANSVSGTWRISGKLDILQSSVVGYLHVGKSIWNCQTVLLVIKILQKF